MKQRQLDKMQHIHIAEMGSLPFVPPLPPHCVMLPQLQSMCYYMVKHSLKERLMRRGVANNMQTLCLGCANAKDSEKESKTKKSNGSSKESSRKERVDCLQK